MITFDSTRLSQQAGDHRHRGVHEDPEVQDRAAGAGVRPADDPRLLRWLWRTTFNNFTSLTVKVQERTNDAGTWTDVVTLASAVVTGDAGEGLRDLRRADAEG